MSLLLPLSRGTQGLTRFSPRRSSPLQFSSPLLQQQSLPHSLLSNPSGYCLIPSLLSKTKFLGGNIYTSYHHLVTSHLPLIHFILASETTALVLLPRATLLPLRQIHGTLAYLGPAQLFTALGTGGHFLIL